MNYPTAQSEIVDKIMCQHEQLREKVQQIHTVLAGPEPTATEIRTLLDEFRTALVVHFSDEEEQGFFQEIKAHALRLADRAGEVCREHRQLVNEAHELCRFAAAGVPSIPWWRELSSRCQLFCKRLMKHELDESKLLIDSHQIDGSNLT